MKGFSQPTRPGFSASNAGLRASSTAVRRSQDRGSATSRHQQPSVKAAAAQREELGPIGLELSKDECMVQWMQERLSAFQGPLKQSAVPVTTHPLIKGWNLEPLASATPPQKAGTAAASAVLPKRSPKAGPLLKAKTLPMVELAVGGWKVCGSP